jgi:hypothetical protein
MKPSLIWGMPIELLNADPALKDLAMFVATQPARTQLAQIVCRNLGNGPRMLKELAAHESRGPVKNTQQNSRKLQALLRGVPMPPSKPRNVSTPTRL